MKKPVLVLDAHWRRNDELFSDETLRALHDRFDVVWGKDEPIPDDVLADALPQAFAYVAATPRVTADTLAIAPHLKLVAEMSGQFPDTVDYAACKAHGVEVLSCAPGFQQSVAEMALAMILAMGRGLVREHEAFRTGKERWLEDCDGEDGTLFGGSVGFVGYGAIAREVHRLMVPFAPKVAAYDPWLDPTKVPDVELADLGPLMARSRILIVAAAPTRDNHGLVSADLLARLPDGALVVLISRAHLVDFDALLKEAKSGRLSAAIDVFPSEPVPQDHPMRQLRNVVFSPHRAAAVPGGRQLIGDLLLKDLDLVMAGKVPQHLNRAANLDVAALAGVGDASSVAAMAEERT